jgi:hypothetical protein
MIAASTQNRRRALVWSGVRMGVGLLKAVISFYRQLKYSATGVIATPGFLGLRWSGAPVGVRNAPPPPRLAR